MTKRNIPLPPATNCRASAAADAPASLSGAHNCSIMVRLTAKKSIVCPGKVCYPILLLFYHGGVFMKKRQKPLRCNLQSAGFTLLEMLVILVIIGLLAGLVGPRLFSKVDDSKIKTANVQIKMLKGALEAMRLDINRFPQTDEGLALLYHKPAKGAIERFWKGPYLDEDVPLDPWGNPYQYSIPGAKGMPFALYSFGADGQPGGNDINADIGYLP